VLAWAALGRGDAAAEPEQDMSGTFASLTHRTTGTAHLVHRADGTRELRLTGFETRTAPDLFVYVIPRPAPGGEIGGGTKIDSLRTPVGDQTYVLPASLELGKNPTVVIWCAKCSVAFGSALLVPAPV
jgi:Electron transfer DM13